MNLSRREFLKYSGAGALALSDVLPWPTVFRIIAVLMLPAVCRASRS